MDKVRVIEIKQCVFKNNDEQAEKLRGELKSKGVFLLNHHTESYNKCA